MELGGGRLARRAQQDGERQIGDDGALADDCQRVIPRPVLVRAKERGEREHRRRDDDADDELTHRPLLEQHREPRQQQLAHRLDKVEPQGAQLVLTDPPLDPPAIAHALLDLLDILLVSHCMAHLELPLDPSEDCLGAAPLLDNRRRLNDHRRLVAELLVAQCDDPPSIAQEHDEHVRGYAERPDGDHRDRVPESVAERRRA